MLNVLEGGIDALSLTFIILFVVGTLGGIALGYFIRIKTREKTISNAKSQAEEIIKNADSEADKKKEEALKEAKDEINKLKNDADEDIKQRKTVVIELENKLDQREGMLDRRSTNLDKREEILNAKEAKIDEKKNELEKQNNKVQEILAQEEKKLSEIANLQPEEAKKIIMEQVREKMHTEIAQYIKDEEDRAKAEAQSKAKNILSLAIQKYSGDVASESTVTTVSLPDEEMKGRIIGREGRNIRAIESLTGVDLIIDDTPDAIVLSGFDPVRREVAKRSLEMLINDGRIHPGRIEEVVERCRSDVENIMKEKGEEAIFKTSIGRVHPELVRLLGRLYFRTSYGQNVLKHSIETCMLAGKMAAEIGENEILARRAGLFHDIGKAVDHEVEGSHVEIGVELAQRYHEPKEVIDAIASHHEDVAPQSIIAVLVASADALSSARPGARSDSIENYAKRLENLEKISNGIKGVKQSFAIQAGREIRVIVNPEAVDDTRSFEIAHEIKEKIEATLQYPGTIKVTVIRETRATEVAK